ncbi:MAG: DEAD/DEAH box helicase, partial [Bacteroidales bacterium]|nr:DEAD/DEAH box helicase [Bacteroidales bacterium]
AACKAAVDGKQVAVLVPTTILALQHYQTFSERLKNLPVTVSYISRLKTAKEIKETLSDLKSGKIDIIIGTHKLVGKSVVFKDLGLLIIDEEQKFGVAVKEKIKQLKVNIDTLTLTATPIPRTLQFSLMGARDLSVINTPPPNRQPIITELHAFDNDTIRDAIYYEVGRNGQVFFVHNRVQNIYEVQGLINKICPEVKTIVAHGQMEGEQLEKIILDFMRGDYDVLICTSIVENGVDIPNANTIIINNANNFGLSDLHQLRGRVGRSNRRAFCYLLTPPLSALTSDARRRLKAIEEFSELGSGINIALQDLDIRGAGNILGGEQSGFIADIGFETYNKILNEAIAELKETEFKDVFEEEIKEDNIIVRDCSMETDLDLMIPDYYISSTSERIKLYRRIDELKNIAELNEFREMLVDRFGKIPEETEKMFDMVKLRWTALRLGFQKITIKNNVFLGYFPFDQKAEYYSSALFMSILQFVQNNPRNLTVKQHNDRLILRIDGIKNLPQIVDFMENMKNSVIQ